MQIKRSELLKKYGIDLPPGKFRVYTKTDEYQIYSVKDDTSGCILVGNTQKQTSEGHWLGDSRDAMNALMPKLQAAFDAGEHVELAIIRKYV